MSKAYSMGRVFITGSSDGLGLMAAKKLVANGQTVYLHARNAQRADDARKACPGAADVLLGDLSSIKETKALAESVTKLGPLDCIFHNAGLYLGPYRAQAEGYPSMFAVNVLAPYILTCLIPLPKRLVYTSSDSHWGGSTDLSDFGWRGRGESGFSAGSAYADTKIYNTMFGYAFARRFGPRGTTAHSVDPGWVPTKMGGAAASGDISESERLYVMLAEGAGEAKGKNGCFWENGKKGPAQSKKDACDEGAQEALLKKLEEVTGVKLPE
ncbi:Uu.00g019660.m01.CDS01 [Anthostomella pinea]|uniref:Uu.00g019660.m01.CDS01 n=1 Tax=Anthostomella pinea TaxID=933095 RepID=A0AAI8YNK9_9PEZI|nr:Uu.00g019660.m01.CDS01 [Anthostomella pinea]